MFAIFVFCGAVFSSLVTITAWDIQIEPRAFQCNDSCGWPFEIFWTPMADHEAAGDVISIGWTWSELVAVREIYIAGFFVLLFVSALIPFWMFLKRIRVPKSPEPSTGGGLIF